MAFVLNNSKLFPLFVFCSGFSTPPSPCSDTYLPAGVGFPLPKDFEANPQRLTAYPAKSSAKHYPYETLPHNLDHRPTNKRSRPHYGLEGKTNCQMYFTSLHNETPQYTVPPIRPFWHYVLLIWSCPGFRSLLPSKLFTLNPLAGMHKAQRQLWHCFRNISFSNFDVQAGGNCTYK